MSTNTGKGCVGSFNTGYWNFGDFNSGAWNCGEGNSGCNNLGDCNSGHRNRGDSNSGNHNSGDSNSGSCNSGNFNTGDWNSGSFNVGFFNRTSPKVFLFEKPTDLTHEEIRSLDGMYALTHSFGNNCWVCDSEMTDEEKQEHPSYKEKGGYFKSMPFKDACALMWSNLMEEEKQSVKDLPNFDAEIFKDITGIDIYGGADPQYYNGKVICVENSGNKLLYTVGKTYQLKNGCLTADNGEVIPGSYPAKSFDDWQRWSTAKWIEAYEQ